MGDPATVGVCGNCGAELDRGYVDECGACYRYRLANGRARPAELWEHLDAVEGLLTGVEASQASGMTYRRIDYAARVGLVEPSVPAIRSGTQRGYTVADVVALAAVREVRGLASRGALAREVEERVVAAARHGAPAVRVARGRVVLVVNLADVRDDVVDRVEGIVRDRPEETDR